MRVAVARDLVSFGHHAAHQRRVATRDPPQHKAGGLDPRPGERVEDLVRVALDARLELVPVGCGEHVLQIFGVKPLLDVERSQEHRLRRHNMRLPLARSLATSAGVGNLKYRFWLMSTGYD